MTLSGVCIARRAGLGVSNTGVVIDALDLPEGLPEDSPVEINFNLNREGRLQITAMETTENRQVVAKIETSSVIQGKELEEAIERAQHLVVH